MKKKIEKRLREAPGYEVATFIRTDTELADIADYKPFRQSDLEAAVALNIAFLADTLDDKSKQKLMASKTEAALCTARRKKFRNRMPPGSKLDVKSNKGELPYHLENKHNGHTV